MVETRLLDRYHLEERIAAGGMGTVWAAQDERLGRRVAVKMLKDDLAGDPRFVERFRREARAVAALGHPNIANVFDYGEDHGKHFIVMELVEGRDLARLLREEGPMNSGRAVSIAAQACEALGHAHLAGVIHRDVKPGNVMVGDDDRVKVTDFGIARERKVTQASRPPVRCSGPLTTYLRSKRREAPSVRPSDVYSMGCVLYEMLTGAVPFTGDSPVGIAMRHVSEEVPAPSSLAPDVPPAVDDVVAKATAKDPNDRFADGRDMAAALAHAGDPKAAGALGAAGAPTAAMAAGDTSVLTHAGQSHEAPQTVWPIPGDRWEPRRVGRFALIALAILAGIAALLLLVNLLGDDDPTPGAGSGGPGPNQEEPPADENQGEEEPEPEAISLDGYVGQFYADAEEQLKAEGIKVARVDVDSAEEPELVVDQDPGEGETVQPGDTVTLSVSNGALIEEEPGDEGEGSSGEDEGKGKAKGHDKDKG